MKRTLLFVLAFMAVGRLSLEAQEPMELNELVQRGDIYLAPETFQPYTGPVFIMRNPSMVGLWASLRNGKWHGPYELYHDETGQLSVRESSGTENSVVSGWKGVRWSVTHRVLPAKLRIYKAPKQT